MDVDTFNEEDYLVAMSFIGICYSIDNKVEMELFDKERERSKMIDLFIRLVNID